MSRGVGLFVIAGVRYDERGQVIGRRRLQSSQRAQLDAATLSSTACPLRYVIVCLHLQQNVPRRRQLRLPRQSKPVFT